MIEDLPEDLQLYMKHYIRNGNISIESFYDTIKNYTWFSEMVDISTYNGLKLLSEYRRMSDYNNSNKHTSYRFEVCYGYICFRLGVDN